MFARCSALFAPWRLIRLILPIRVYCNILASIFVLQKITYFLDRCVFYYVVIFILFIYFIYLIYCVVTPINLHTIPIPIPIVRLRSYIFTCHDDFSTPEPSSNLY